MTVRLALGILSGRITVVNVQNEVKYVSVNPVYVADWMIHWDHAQKWAEELIASIIESLI